MCKEKKGNETEEIFEIIMAENCPKLMTANHRYRKLRKYQHNKLPSNCNCAYHIHTEKRRQRTETILKGAREGGGHPTYERTGIGITGGKK